MGTKKRPDGMVPWMPGFRYGALLPPLSLNLIVADTARSAAFYRDIFGAEVHYQDIDFAAVRVGPAEVMLHADHTHSDHPWAEALAAGHPRGLGAQVRLLGIDPDEVERRAREAGAEIAVATASKGHGWREVLVRDPDGYEWAVGVLVEPAKGPFGLQPAPPASAPAS
jgi:catechol 2,3-dioxygenase-like lactoylglutathione lyase family enzyme